MGIRLCRRMSGIGCAGASAWTRCPTHRGPSRCRHCWRTCARATKRCACAAYALAAMGAPVVPALLEVLREEAPARCRHNVGRSQANPAGGNPSDLHAVHALSAVGSPAVARLSAALRDNEWAVRAAAADALGNIGVRARSAESALLRALGDDSTWVRRNTLEALGTIGCAGGDVLSGLLAALQDGDHSVRRNAAIAVSKIAGSAANETRRYPLCWRRSCGTNATSASTPRPRWDESAPARREARCWTPVPTPHGPLPLRSTRHSHAVIHASAVLRSCGH